eukprot:TRINITY_DN21675_c0_g1_i1.p1 TRINITY_DN21675_c0_g1~~TRINITY_DN21675_c0_g1_i1.p1  ORF type:complete len:368 (-),score=49.37 TRINITY_DN21675_c0_g1_i1:731-1834(-)
MFAASRSTLCLGTGRLPKSISSGTQRQATFISRETRSRDSSSFLPTSASSRVGVPSIGASRTDTLFRCTRPVLAAGGAPTGPKRGGSFAKMHNPTWSGIMRGLHPRSHKAKFFRTVPRFMWSRRPMNVGLHAESHIDEDSGVMRRIKNQQGTLLSRQYDWDTGELLGFTGQMHNISSRGAQLWRAKVFVNRLPLSLPELKAQLKFFPFSVGRYLLDLVTVMEREAVTMYRWDPARIAVHYFRYKTTGTQQFLQIRGHGHSSVHAHRRYTIALSFTHCQEAPPKMFEMTSPRALPGETMRDFVRRRDQHWAYRHWVEPMQQKTPIWIYPQVDIHNGFKVAFPLIKGPLTPKLTKYMPKAMHGANASID